MSKRKVKVEFLNRSNVVECWTCSGKDKECPTCKGSGKFVDDNFILVAENNKGEKIAFQVDGLK
jgi:DnaJ-class molecular chaperone